MVKVFIAVLVTCVVMIVIFQFIDPGVDTSNYTSAIVSNSSSSGTISVSISGEITRAGTYIMEVNTTLGDLISTASGVTSNADEHAYDTNYLLSDSLSFYIAPKYDNSDVCSLTPIVKANINTDSEDNMQVVSGIGSSTAKAIVSYREANGKFGRIEDVKKVSGIGNATFEKIKNYICLSSWDCLHL